MTPTGMESKIRDSACSRSRAIAKDRDTLFYLRGPWENRASSEAS